MYKIGNFITRFGVIILIFISGVIIYPEVIRFIDTTIKYQNIDMKINNTAVIEELENKLVKVTINNKSYGARFNKGHRNLVVMLEPEEDEKLRTKSVFIQDKDLPIIRKFMQTYLLSTMYMEGGIGIAAIQVGLPIKAFIVDIPTNKILSNNGKYKTIDNPKYVKEQLSTGQHVIKKELTPKYENGKMKYNEKITILRPKFQETEQGKVLVGVEEENVQNISEIPTIITERNPVFIINPQIIKTSEEEIIIAEGCLSVPPELVKEKYGDNTNVKRPVSITLQYTDEHGEKQELAIDGKKVTIGSGFPVVLNMNLTILKEFYLQINCTTL